VIKGSALPFLSVDLFATTGPSQEDQWPGKPVGVLSAGCFKAQTIVVSL